MSRLSLSYSSKLAYSVLGIVDRGGEERGATKIARPAAALIRASSGEVLGSRGCMRAVRP